MHQIYIRSNQKATQRPKPSQNHLTESLHRLLSYRRALDVWRAAGPSGTPPQPSEFGLRLPAIESSNVFWGLPC